MIPDSRLRMQNLHTAVNSLSTMAKGIFPQMTISDITSALAGWGLSVSHEQLIRPSADFVESVYCACLEQVTDLNHDSFRDPVHNALASSGIEDKVSQVFIYSSVAQGLPRIFIRLH